ncbi:MAG TPA: redoxin domain-containing protein [Gemmataceae bacterium]|jgi:peroxiredoxin|nr:redoxin domain-containing protein [Gemmataceae bacterium]
MRRFRLSLLAGLAIAGFAIADTDDSSDKLGKKVDPALIDQAGKTVALASVKGDKATVVVFLSFDCPNSNGYTPTLLQLHKDFADKGVKLVGISETDLTSDELKAKVAEYKLPFPVFADPKQATADAFKAKITPEAFVLDHNLVLRYRGRIDNMFTDRLKRSPAVTDHDLRNALEDLVAGKAIRTPVTKAVGCPIGGREVAVKTPTSVTFHKDVQPILQKSCQNCHRPGEVGPFSLMTYKQAVTWAEDIKDYTANKKMPPWKPTAATYEFHGERKLTDAEIKTLAAWADGGTPEGDIKDAPPPAKFADGWSLGKPDLVLTTDDDFNLGPSGGDNFRCYVLPTNLTEDKYIIGYEVKPGNPRIVHHTLNYWDLSGKAREMEADAKKKASATDRDRGPGYSASMGVGFFPGKSPRPDVPSMGNFGGWAPGSVYRFLPQGTGYLLPKGADVVLQVHYHRDGKPEKDRTKIGLYFAKKPVEHPYQTLVLGPRNPLIVIPADKEDYKIEGSFYLHSDCTMHSAMPHMHLIGKSVTISMTPPGGTKVPLVGIDAWDYNWQETYWFKEPLKLRAGTKIEIEAIFDNSSKNPNNPKSPPGTVFFGEQTTNEMLFGFFGVTTADNGRVRLGAKPPEAVNK